MARLPRRHSTACWAPFARYGNATAELIAVLVAVAESYRIHL